MKKTVYLVYPGLGKTYAAKIDKRVLEVQYNYFYNINRRLLGDHFPEDKKMHLELELKVDPEFPNNIINFINEGLKENKYPVMALKTQNINFCLEYGFDFAFLIPRESRYLQLEEDYNQRGNTDEYINRNMNILKNLERNLAQYNKKIYFLDKGEYLIDFINKIDKIDS